VRSDQNPEKTFKILDMLSLNPPTRPTTQTPPNAVMNMGKMGIIISLLKSFRKLTMPNKSIFVLTPFRYLFLFIVHETLSLKKEKVCAKRKKYTSFPKCQMQIGNAKSLSIMPYTL
jgi:hypothetical protein